MYPIYSLPAGFSKPSSSVAAGRAVVRVLPRRCSPTHRRRQVLHGGDDHGGLAFLGVAEPLHERGADELRQAHAARQNAVLGAKEMSCSRRRTRSQRTAPSCRTCHIHCAGTTRAPRTGSASPYDLAGWLPRLAGSMASNVVACSWCGSTTSSSQYLKPTTGAGRQAAIGAPNRQRGLRERAIGAVLRERLLWYAVS